MATNREIVQDAGGTSQDFEDGTSRLNRWVSLVHKESREPIGADLVDDYGRRPGTFHCFTPDRGFWHRSADYDIVPASTEAPSAD